MKRLAADDGQALVIVIVFITSFTLVLTALLGMSSSALGVNRTAASQSRQLEAADAGGEYGIQKVRAGTVSTLAAPSFSGPAPTTVDTESVSVVLLQRDFTTLSIAGPGTASLGQTTQYTGVGGAAMPVMTHGIAWSATRGGVAEPATVMEPQTGRFTPAVPGAYVITGTLANVSATKAVTVP